MSKFESVSPILFHGPTGQTKATMAAEVWGRLIGIFGNPVEGLNAETVREASQVMSSSPIGDKRGSMVIGPVDILTYDWVMDMLLKVLEETHPLAPQPFLWAYDIGSVRPTIQSRCLPEWCPGIVALDRQSMELAKSVISSSMARSNVGVLSTMIGGFSEFKSKRGDSEDGETKAVTWDECGEDFLRAAALVISRTRDIEHLRLWRRLRPLMLSRNPPPVTEVLAGFL